MRSTSGCEEACAAPGASRRRAVAAHAHPRLDERPGQPRPDGALVVGGVALADAALVARGVAGSPGASDRSPSGVHSCASTASTTARARSPVEQRERQAADREDLVGAEARVGGARDVVTSTTS